MADAYLEQKKTLEDLRAKLKEKHKCAVIRPTGFGKTYMLAELIGDYKKTLYLYPSAVIRDTVVERCMDLEEDSIDYDPETEETRQALSLLDTCTLMTYTKLARLTEDEIDNLKFDLIIFDEMHRLGAPMTKRAVDLLFAANPTSDFAGATATPDRMDGFDTVSWFFAGIVTYAYDLREAIDSGILQRPNYCYCTYDVKADLENKFIEAGEDPKDKDNASILDIARLKISQIYNMPNIIKSMCEEYTESTDYMKFVVFFANIQHMDQKMKDVVGWFKEAFPSHNIETLRISTASTSESKNTDKLQDLHRRTNTIDLICCVNMLNLGYHVTDLTGIVMYRGTKSSTIYIQQLGRVLSAGSKSAAIVFDVVDNLHRKAVFDLQQKEKNEEKETVATNMAIADDGVSVVIISGNSVIKTQWQLVNGEIVDQHGNPSDFEYDPDTGRITQRVNRRRANNRVTSDCIHASGHLSSYKEMLDKIITEPVIKRSRWAAYLHFEYFFRTAGIPCPVQWNDMEAMMDLENDDFCGKIKALIIPAGYPADDAAKLKAIGSNNDGIPLKVAAYAKNVTQKQLLSVYGHI